MNNKVVSAYSEYNIAHLHNIVNNSSRVNVLVFGTLHFIILLNVKEKPLHQRFLHNFLKTGFVMVLCHQIIGLSPTRLDYPLCLRVNAKFLRCQCNGSKHLMLHVLSSGRDFSLGTIIILRVWKIINLFFTIFIIFIK